MTSMVDLAVHKYAPVKAEVTNFFQLGCDSVRFHLQFGRCVKVCLNVEYIRFFQMKIRLSEYMMAFPALVYRMDVPDAELHWVHPDVAYTQVFPDVE